MLGAEEEGGGSMFSGWGHREQEETAVRELQLPKQHYWR